VGTAIDMWSLGCVLSVAATWLVLGVHEVEVYNQVRIDASIRRSHILPQEQAPGNFFHDGRDVFPEISAWHKLLKGTLCSGDYMTADVLDLVETHLLLGKPDKRMEARQLVYQFAALESKWEKVQRPERTIDPLILASFRTYNEEKGHAYGLLRGFSVPVNEDKREKQRNIHRDQADVFSLNVIDKSGLAPQVDEALREISSARAAAQAVEGKPRALQVDTHITADTRLRSTTRSPAVSPSRPMREHKQLPRDPENVFQARAKFRKEKDFIRKGIVVVPPLDKKLIAKYKDRDIVS
jgi:hypothetical protein